MAIEIGLVGEIKVIVDESQTAAALKGEKLAPVLSTPVLIGLMEAASHRAIGPHLSEGQSSVGTTVNIRHLAATPVGMEVRVRSELIEAEGRRLLFKVEAWDTQEKIGEGQHERFIIDWDRFMAKVAKKSAG